MGQVVSQSELIAHRGEWKRRGQMVVCVCGAFDLFHPGHIRLIEQARALGDVLVVLVEAATPSPAVVGQREPCNRTVVATPSTLFTPPIERAEILAALAAVDDVTTIEAASRGEFLARLRPDILARGAAIRVSKEDRWEDGEIEALSCRVVRIPLEPGYSVANLLKRIAELPA